MPKLYVANATQQVQQFNYWLPEAPRYFTAEIPIGGQVLIAGKDLPRPSIDGILKQHESYGLRSVADALRTPNFSGVCYSIDKPVSYVSLLELVTRRRGVLVDQGKKLREEAAIATDAAIQDQMIQSQAPGRLQNREMSVEEISRDKNDDSPEISEGVRVTRRQGPEEPGPSRRGQARAASRRGRARAGA